MELTDDAKAIDLHVEATSRLVEALAAAESRMQRRINLLSEVVFEVDLAGTIVYLNEAWSRLSGHTTSACIGQPIFDFFMAVDADLLRQEMVGAEGQKTIRQAQLSVKAGAIAWVSIALSPLPGGGFVGVLHDITADKRVQDEVAKLSAVASATDNLVLITDASGLTEWVNDAFTKRTGFDLADMVGKKPGSVLQGPSTDRSTVHRIREAIVDHRSIREELLNYTKTGEPYWVVINLTPIRDEAGTVTRYISVQADTTDRKWFEGQLLQQNAELERGRTQMRQALDAAEAANQAKSAFLANMSHELRTPLTGILGVAGALAQSTLDAKQQDLIHLVSESAKGLEAILSDILDFSKIEAGQLTLEVAPFVPSASLRNIAALMAVRISEKGIDFQVHSDGSLDGTFEGDALRINQILANLLSNAVKFTDSGVIDLSVTVSPAPTEPLGHRLKIVVRDTGIGFDEQVQGRLFDRFEQADASFTRKYGGTGLGLPISSALLTLMGGQIEVASSPGQGSEFTVSIPLQAVKTPEMQTPDFVQPRSLAGLRVLLAEDHPTNQRVVSIILEPQGVDLTIVDDGAKAVEAFINGSFDLVLMDLQMPVMDGLEAIRRIRDVERTEGLRPTLISVLSANVAAEHKRLALESGADGHIGKPFTPATLVGPITDLMRRRSDHSGPH